MASLKRDLPLDRAKRPRRPRAARFLRWRKAYRDLSFDRLRTLLVIVSLGIGVTVFGLIVITTIVIPTVALESFLETEPASASLSIPAGFDQALIDSVERMPEVLAASGRRQATIRVRDANDEWVDMNLIYASTLEEEEAPPIDIIKFEEGVWPPAPRELALERNSRFYTGLALGDVIEVEAPDGRLLSMPISSITYDPSRPPSQVAGVGYAFVDRETFEWLGIPTTYNELRFRVAEHPNDVQHIQAVSDLVEDKVARNGLMIQDINIPTPGEHPLGFLLDTVIIILRVVAGMALVLSMFLIVNTLTALLTQQGQQIAVMKAIGAPNGLIMGVYLRMVLLLALAALVFSLPLAIVIGNVFSRFIAWQLNVELDQLMAPLSGIVAILLGGLAFPLVATLMPIRGRSVITIREALDDRASGGASAPTEDQPFRQRLQRLFFLFQSLFSRPLRLSLRNTFRRKGRLLLTLFTLMLGGAIFIGVMTLRTSISGTLEQTIINQGFDISIQTDQPERITRLSRIVEATPGVTQSEGWLIQPAIIVMPDGRDGARIEMRAMPPDTPFFTPELESGRWFQADEANGVVLHRGIFNEIPDAQIGDTLTLKVHNKEIEWVIVGITEELTPPLSPILAYVDYESFAHRFELVDKTNTLRIQTAEHDAAFIDKVVLEIEAELLAAGLEPKSITTIQVLRDIITERFNLVTIILTLLASMIATVGGLGLMGTMSINVLERRREIGIMRSIGGTDRALQWIFIIEGLIIGLISWVGASILGQPIGWALSFQIGNTLLQTPIEPIVAWWAIGLWLLIVGVIALLSSYVPARQATDISIRETLAYE